MRGRGVGARQEGHLHRVLRRQGRAHHRPRHLHLLRQVRRGVPGRGDRLRAVARELQDPRRRDSHRRRLRAGAAEVLLRVPPRPRERRDAGGARVDARRLGGPSLPRPHAGQGTRHDPVRRLARQAPPAALLASLLHDRAQARDPAQDALPRDEDHGLLLGDEDRRRGLRALVPGRSRGRRGVPARHAARGAAGRRRPAGDRGRGRDRGAQARAAARPGRPQHGHGPGRGDRAPRAVARGRARRRRLHRHPRPQEPRHRDEHRGHLRVRLGGRSQGAHRGQHGGGRGRRPDPHVPHLTRPPRHGAVPSGRRPVRGLRHLHDHVPLRRDHPRGAGRPARRVRPRSRTTASWR